MTHPIFNLPIEMFICIFDFLSIKDRQLLKYTNKFFNDIIKIRIDNFDEMITKIISNILENQTLSKKIIELVKLSNGYIQIGGSTILQSIHYDFYDNCDIDIYIDCTQMLKKVSWWDETFKKYKNTCKFSKNTNDTCPLKSTIIDKMPCIRFYDKLLNLLCDNGMSYDDNIINIYSFASSITNVYHMNDNNKNTKIQIILTTTNYTDIPHDFTFCKNNYDGKNVYSLCKSDVLNKSGTLNDWNILNKKINNSNQKLKAQKIIMNRFIKYYFRGYNIKNMYARYESLLPDVRHIYNNLYHPRDSKFRLLDLPNKLIRLISKYMSFSDKKIFKCTCKQIDYIIKCDIKMYRNIVIEKINALCILPCSAITDYKPNFFGSYLINEIKYSNNNILLFDGIISQCLNSQFSENTCINILVKYEQSSTNLAMSLCQKYVSNIICLLTDSFNLNVDWKNNDKYPVSFDTSKFLPNTFILNFINKSNIHIFQVIIVPTEFNIENVHDNHLWFDGHNIYCDNVHNYLTKQLDSK